MYCSQCGLSNDASAAICASCGAPLAGAHGGAVQQKVPSYLAFSIVTTICCCSPAGVPAVVYAARVGPLQEAGKVDAARDASSKALVWSIVAAVLGLAVWAGTLLLNLTALKDLRGF